MACSSRYHKTSRSSFL